MAVRVISMVFLPMVFVEAPVLYHIREGNYGDIKLDGLDVVSALSWPKAIHEGNGTMQLYITKNAVDNYDNNKGHALIDLFRVKLKEKVLLLSLQGQ